MPVKKFCEEVAVEFDSEAKTISSIISESLHPDVAIQVKFDRKYPLDISLKRLDGSLITCRFNEQNIGNEFHVDSVCARGAYIEVID